MTPEFFTIIFAVLFKAVLWGAAENRQFRDTDWGTQGSGILHLTTYHIWMFIFFATLNLGYTAAITGAWHIQIILFIFFTIWDILVLDISWWVIRYFDIIYMGKSITFFGYAIHKFPTTNSYDKGKGKPWHSPSDWDAAELPLWLKTYAWWWITAGILIVLTTSIWLVPK